MCNCSRETSYKERLVHRFKTARGGGAFAEGARFYSSSFGSWNKAAKEVYSRQDPTGLPGLSRVQADSN